MPERVAGKFICDWADSSCLLRIHKHTKVESILKTISHAKEQ